tara:strand:- start:109 stop:273 length:165 start_codon:yes stop_codon:yes gene_type:complete
MARSARIEFSGALCHVASSVDREDIYDSDNTRNLSLKILAKVCKRFNWDAIVTV